MSEQYELPSPGAYNAVAIERTDDQGLTAYARWSLTKEGNTQVSATFRLLDFPNSTPTWYGSFSKTVMKKSNKTVARRTVESLRYMGFKGDDFLQLETQKLDQIVSITVEHKINEKDGNTYLGVGWVNQLGGGVIKIARPLNDQDKRRFAAMMRDNLSKVPEVDSERHESTASAPASNGVQSSAPPPADDGGWGGNPNDPPPPDDMDDIPF